MRIMRPANSIFILLASGVLFALFFAGCASSSKEVPGFETGAVTSGPQLTPVAGEAWQEPELAPPDPFFHDPPRGVVQKLLPGDVYFFKIIGTPIEGNVSVSLTGTVDLPDPTERANLTEEFVQGMFPEEFRSFLAKRYGEIIRDPEVFLARIKYQPRLAYVVGLRYPQRSIELTDGSTVLSVMTEALWTPGLDGDTVIVFRKGRTRRIWLPHIYRDGKTKENIRLLPGDVLVVVPRRGVEVYGAAKNPGRFFPDGKTPLTNFLLTTGGVRERASLGGVHVFYSDGTEESVNLQTARGEEVPVVGDGDVVYIPSQREVRVYPAGQLIRYRYEKIPQGLRLSQFLAFHRPRQFGSALDKTTVIPPDGSEAIKVDGQKLLEGASDQPDPVILPGTVVYVPSTRTLRVLWLLHEIAKIFNPIPVDPEPRYATNRPNRINQPPLGPTPVVLRNRYPRESPLRNFPARPRDE